MTAGAGRSTSGAVSPPPPAETTLRAEGLTVEFATEHGWTTVVDDVSLSVPAGTTLGLVGESGSGKTVTSLAAMGLLPRDTARVTGSVEVLGTQMLGRTERELAEIRGRVVSMVFQEPRRSLSPSLTVGEQIAEVVRRHEGASGRAAAARAVEMLERVGIPDPRERARQYPHQFSGGMCQRVMLAIATVCRPALLIADEPTTALDVTVQAEMLRLMKALQEDFGVAILFITHDLGVVATMCDRVAVMYAGQVVETADVDDLFTTPVHPYSEGLLGAVPDPAARGHALTAIPGVVPAPWDWPGSCRFFSRCEHRVPGFCDSGPVPLIPVGADRASRCVRADQLTLRGL